MGGLFYSWPFCWALRFVKNFSQKLAIASIKFYKYFISPYLGDCCIYKVSCSDYARLAILKHGVWRGSFKVLVRLLHCHPFVDMVTRSNLEKI